MALALLERPDGSLASPLAADPAAALGILAILLPAALPAAVAGADATTRLASCCFLLLCCLTPLIPCRYKLHTFSRHLSATGNEHGLLSASLAPF